MEYRDSASIPTLPHEIWFQIISLLDGDDVVHLVKVNRFFGGLCKENTTWFNVYKNSRPRLSRHYEYSAVENWCGKYKSEEIYKSWFKSPQVAEVNLDVDSNEEILCVNETYSDINDRNEGVVGALFHLARSLRITLHEFPGYKVIRTFDFEHREHEFDVMVCVNYERKLLVTARLSIEELEDVCTELQFFHYGTDELIATLRFDGRFLFRFIVDFVPPNAPDDEDSVVLICQATDESAKCEVLTYTFPDMSLTSAVNISVPESNITAIFYEGKYDKDVLITGHSDGYLRLWNPVSGDQLHTIHFGNDAYIEYLVIREFEDALGFAGFCDRKSVRQYVVGIAGRPIADVAYEDQSLLTLKVVQAIRGKTLMEEQELKTLNMFDAVTFGVYHNLLFYVTRGGFFKVLDLETDEEVYSLEIPSEERMKIKCLMFAGNSFEEVLLCAGKSIIRVGNLVQSKS
ncbi:hypothetical protein BKA69DRAFT_1103179 [Paraphysoderma sedebokerense]|nr:hypothetical protein BKA69DRAFT_1103179 [Paraphysoderma sedebokerense]